MKLQAIHTPEAIADIFKGELVPVIHASHPAQVIGMIWRDEFDKWKDEFLEIKTQRFLMIRHLPTGKVTKQVTTAGRPYVLCE